MSARDILFEIGTEEIPARFMPKALEDLRLYAEDEFSSYNGAVHSQKARAFRQECGRGAKRYYRSSKRPYEGTGL